MTMVSVPWHAWYGDEWLTLRFPASWRARAYWPHDAADIGIPGIEAAFDQPIESPPIEELASGKRTVAIAVDDLSRPTPTSRILPILLNRLERGGVDLDNVRIVLAIGTHRQMVKADIVKKIGQEAANRLEVRNNHAWENTVDLGTTPQGTPVHICRHFAEADLKIGIGSIMPHGAPGFSGGAKIVVPGVSGVDTIEYVHSGGRFRGGLAQACTAWRAEVEFVAREHVGLDCIVNSVPNSRRGIAGLFVGDLVAAHRAGVSVARQVSATPLPPDPVDVLVLNTYPKDSMYSQHGLAHNVLISSPKPLVKEGGVIVKIAASPEGRGRHGLFGPGMRLDRGALPGPRRSLHGEREILFLSPHLSVHDTDGTPTYRHWEEIVAHIESGSARGQALTAAVFPCAPIQLAE